MDPLERRFDPAFQVDLRLTLGIHRRGSADPTLRFSRDGSVWRASRTPEGPVTLRLVPDGAGIRAQAWGPGAAWAIEQAPELVGADDDPGAFAALLGDGVDPAGAHEAGVGPAGAGNAGAAATRLLRDLLVRFGGVRIGRSRRVLEALVPAIIEQKVTGDEARAAFVALVRRYGEPAPGPWDAAPSSASVVGSSLVPMRVSRAVDGFPGPLVVPPSAARSPAPLRVPPSPARSPAPLRVPPAPEVLAGLPGYAYHPLGLERRRADAIRFAASRAIRVEECADLPLANAYARLRAIPVVGAWTAAEVGLRALGDQDAVSVGDLHLAPAVCWALAGEMGGTDERMLELLAPFAGHRARVIRLIESAGIQAPRRGPRMAPRSIAGI